MSKKTIRLKDGSILIEEKSFGQVEMVVENQFNATVVELTKFQQRQMRDFLLKSINSIGEVKKGDTVRVEVFGVGEVMNKIQDTMSVLFKDRSGKCFVEIIEEHQVVGVC